MGLTDNLGSKYVNRKCPAGKNHKVNKDDLSCGHTGKILDWCETYQKWIVNPTKTKMVIEMIKNDDEYEIDREAREKITEALKNGDLTPAIDYRKLLMNRD